MKWQNQIINQGIHAKPQLLKYHNFLAKRCFNLSTVLLQSNLWHLQSRSMPLSSNDPKKWEKLIISTLMTFGLVNWNVLPSRLHSHDPVLVPYSFKNRQISPELQQSRRQETLRKRPVTHITKDPLILITSTPIICHPRCKCDAFSQNFITQIIVKNWLL